MIDGMFQTGTDAALDDQVRRYTPRQAPRPPFRMSDLAKAPFQGIGGGTAGSMAFGAEILGAFGQVGGAYPEAIGVTDLTPEQRKQTDAQRQKIATLGLDYSNEIGDALRTRAKDIMPDPQTTHASAQVVAGLTEFATKAIGYTAAAGPVVGAALTGGDVALSEADRLKQLGVDETTRAKAAAAAGVLAGGSMLVPMTGPTWYARFGTGVVAGEAGTVGTALAEKKILEGAGYGKIADTFDPLDPVALALGVVPGALGAKFGRPRVVEPLRTEADVRAAAKLTPEEQARSDAFERSAANLAELEAAIKAEKNPEARAVLEAELVKQRTAAAGEMGRRAIEAHPDLEAAVRVRATADAVEASRLAPEGDIAGSEAHLSAVELAADQMARGDDVSVSDVATRSLPDIPPADLSAGRALALELSARVERTAGADIGRSVDLLRAEVQRLRKLPDGPSRVAAQILDTAAASRAGAPHVVERVARTADAADQLLKILPREQVRGELTGVREPGIPRVPRAEPSKAPAAAAGRPATAANQPGKGVGASEGAEGHAAASLSQSATEVAALNPDLLVHMDDLPGGMRAGDLLARVREEAAADARDARLIEVAVACGLRN